MTAVEFWHSTPRKLAALCKVHADLNNPKRSNNMPQTIDGVPAQKANTKPTRGFVGAPDTFVDQIPMPK